MHICSERVCGMYTDEVEQGHYLMHTDVLFNCLIISLGDKKPLNALTTITTDTHTHTPTCIHR